MDDLILSDLPETIIGTFPSSVPLKDIYVQNHHSRAKRVIFLTPKSRLKYVLAHTPWGNGRRETRKNSSREVGGDEVAHMKVIGHDLGQAKQYF